MYPYLLPRLFTKRHLAESSSLSPELSTLLFPSHIHSTNIYQAPFHKPQASAVPVPLGHQLLAPHVTCQDCFPQSACPTPTILSLCPFPCFRGTCLDSGPLRGKRGVRRGLRPCRVGQEGRKQLEVGRHLCRDQSSHNWGLGSLGLQPDRAAEGAARSPEGHGGDVAVATRR